MDLALTPEQEMLKMAVRRFVQEEYPKETLLRIASLDDATDDTTPVAPWDRLSSTGWLGTLIPEEFGGEGGSFTDAGVLFEELGRGPVPGPHLSSGVLAALTILEGGTPQQKSDWLPQIASGQMRVAPAVTEPEYGWFEEDVRLAASTDGDNYRLNGSKSFVYDGQSATHFLCAACFQGTGEVGLIMVPADGPGVASRGLPGFAWNLSEVRLSEVRAGAADLLGGTFAGGWAALERGIAKSVPVLCAFKVGGCQAVYELSVEYCRTRIQFGTPIGRFQRVQDHVIDLVNALDAARWTAYEALWKLDTGREAAEGIHLAKVVGSESYYEACNFAHEVHAGVGSMIEYGLTLHTAASRTLYHYLGDPKFHRRRLAEALGL